MPFEKGQSGNPGGRKKNDAREQLEKALAAEGKKHKTTFLKVVAKDAFVDKDTKLAVLKMLIPTLKATDVNLAVEDGSIIFKVKLDGNNSRLPGKSKTKSRVAIPDAGK